MGKKKKSAKPLTGASGNDKIRTNVHVVLKTVAKRRRNNMIQEKYEQLAMLISDMDEEEFDLFLKLAAEEIEKMEQRAEN